MIATFGSAANAGFFIYVADSLGYMGSVGTLLFKNFSNEKISWLDFLTSTSYGLALAGCILIILSIIYFTSKFNAPGSFTSKSHFVEIKPIYTNT